VDFSTRVAELGLEASAFFDGIAKTVTLQVDKLLRGQYPDDVIVGCAQRRPGETETSATYSRLRSRCESA
jgi:hypothetical protein